MTSHTREREPNPYRPIDSRPSNRTVAKEALKEARRILEEISHRQTASR